MNTTAQQPISAAPLHPGPAKCGAIEQLEARFELPDCGPIGGINIEQSGFDVYTVSVAASPEYNHSTYAIEHGVKGEDVVDSLLNLLLETVPDRKATLVAATCSGQSYAWSLIRDVALERLDNERRERMEHKYGGREDVSF